MLKLTALVSSLALMGCAFAGTTPAPTLTFKIIAINDFHGNIKSPGTFKANASASSVASGGIDYLAGYIAAARAANPNLAVVSAGDMIGASPLVSALFHDEPTIETMNLAGLDFNAVGNHEFDDGGNELTRMQKGGCHPTDPLNSCQGALVGTAVPFSGAKFKFLAANVIRKKNGATVFPAYGFKQFDASGKKIKVAFIGLTLKETPQIVTPTGVKDFDFKDEVETINALVPKLRAGGMEAIVVLIHQGGAQTSSGTVDINACAGNLDGSPIKTIVSQLDDAVDLVISGHTHAAYNCMLPNSTGRNISVTSANNYGRVITDIDVTLDRATRDVTKIVATNKVVDRTNAAITPNSQVASIVSAYDALVAPIANQVIGRITTALPNTKDAACNMPAGSLIADSQLAATSAANLGGATLALMNPGGVRSPGFTYANSSANEGDGNVTYGEAFTVQPFGNSLVTMTLSNQQIRDTLEQQFTGCYGQTTNKVLLASVGFAYEWDYTAACGARVRNVTLTTGGVTETLVDTAGNVVNPTATRRVTVNNFLSTGGDGFTKLTGGTNLLGGAQDIDALSAYMATTLAPNPAYDPTAAKLGNPRFVRVDSGTVCP